MATQSIPVFHHEICGGPKYTPCWFVVDKALSAFTQAKKTQLHVSYESPNLYLGAYKRFILEVTLLGERVTFNFERVCAKCHYLPYHLTGGNCEALDRPWEW